MKKDFLWSLMAVMIAMTISVSFVSCDNDDDNGSSGVDNVSALTGIIDKESGLRLKSFSSRELHYSDDGVLESITYSDDDMEEQYTFDYPANKIIETWKISDGETGTQFHSVKYNNQGFITLLDTEYEEDNYAISEKNSFNYDSEGHLSSCSLYGVIDRIKDGERLYLEWNYKVTFDWKDGLLQYLTFDGEETENETKSSGSYKYKYYYDADYPNKYKQWGIYHGFPSVGDTYFFLPFIGLMGIGPDRLPSSMTYIDSDNQEDPDKWNFRFTFNEDGSLATMAGFVFSYEYANGNVETRLAAPSVMTVEDGTGFRPKHRHAPLFGGIPVTGKE
jgi:uncharacterized lipoprotein YehR (DUF1307 family)